MAEIAGLVLGAIPLIVLALDRYAEPIGAFHRYRISIETFRADLVLQHRSLHRTLSAIGLGDSPSFEELKSRFECFFPDICSELITFIGRMDQVIADLMKDLNVNFDVEVGIAYPNLIKTLCSSISLANELIDLLVTNFARQSPVGMAKSETQPRHQETQQVYCRSPTLERRSKQSARASRGAPRR
jgi:hypothetical protein